MPWLRMVMSCFALVFDSIPLKELGIVEIGEVDAVAADSSGVGARTP